MFLIMTLVTVSMNIRPPADRGHYLGKLNCALLGFNYIYRQTTAMRMVLGDTE